MVPATYEEACARIVELERRLQWADQRPGGGPKQVRAFTHTETRVLRLMAARGFVSYEMFDALQRHMSNIRKKLPNEIRVKTQIGEGYEITDGIETLRALVAGDITLIIEAVTEAIARKPKKRSTQNPRALARQAERRQRRRSKPRPTVSIVMGGRTA